MPRHNGQTRRNAKGRTDHRVHEREDSRMRKRRRMAEAAKRPNRQTSKAL